MIDSRETDHLDSWKEIATYLDRGLRTVYGLVLQDFWRHAIIFYHGANSIGEPDRFPCEEGG